MKPVSATRPEANAPTKESIIPNELIMPVFQIMHVVAAPVLQGLRKTDHERDILEMVVCLNSRGQLAATLEDVVYQHCRLLRHGREAWSGRLRMDEGRWIIQADPDDNEPIKLLQVRTLRPGDHLTVISPGNRAIDFKIECVSQQHQRSIVTVQSRSDRSANTGNRKQLVGA